LFCQPEEVRGRLRDDANAVQVVIRRIIRRDGDDRSSGAGLLNTRCEIVEGIVHVRQLRQILPRRGAAVDDRRAVEIVKRERRNRGEHPRAHRPLLSRPLATVDVVEVLELRHKRDTRCLRLQPLLANDAVQVITHVLSAISPPIRHRRHIADQIELVHRRQFGRISLRNHPALSVKLPLRRVERCICQLNPVPAAVVSILSQSAVRINDACHASQAVVTIGGRCEDPEGRLIRSERVKETNPLFPISAVRSASSHRRTNQ